MGPKVKIKIDRREKRISLGGRLAVRWRIAINRQGERYAMGGAEGPAKGLPVWRGADGDL